MKKIFSAAMLAVLLSIAWPFGASAGTPVYNDFSTKEGRLGLRNTIAITITGAAADAGAGGTLIDHQIQYMQDIIDSGAQLMEVELIPGTGAAEPSAASVWISNAATAGTIIWGPTTIDNTTADSDPGKLYGGHEKWGVLPVGGQWYLTVGDLGDANTLKIILRFK